MRGAVWFGPACPEDVIAKFGTLIPQFGFAMLSSLRPAKLSRDTASKAGEQHDFSVCTTWGVAGGDLYLLDVDRARRDSPFLKRRIVELAIQWNARNIIIEDKGSGTSLI